MGPGEWPEDLLAVVSLYRPQVLIDTMDSSDATSFCLTANMDPASAL
jgi:hypothetical protein